MRGQCRSIHAWRLQVCKCSSLSCDKLEHTDYLGVLADEKKVFSPISIYEENINENLW